MSVRIYVLPILYDLLSVGHILRKRNWACSSFVMISGHADNPATGKVYDGSFFNAKFTSFLTGDYPIISSDESLLLRKSSMKNSEKPLVGKVVNFSMILKPGVPTCVNKG